MSRTIQSIRGMHDVLPDEAGRWQAFELSVRQLMPVYGYREIRTPSVEPTDLFCRSIGEVTDIVEKEMYTFEDRNGDKLTLRPEGTASCVRAGIEHGILHNQVQRLWYMGPMFRHERPQKGRYRQFHQFGVECFGIATPDIDAELIIMTARLWRNLALDGIRLELNTLGSNSARAAYRDVLVDYLNSHRDALDEDSLRRLDSNPLRILDSKNPAMQSLIESAPALMDYLDTESADDFAALKAYLDDAGIGYSINPRLVRGWIITARRYSNGSPTGSAHRARSVPAVVMTAWWNSSAGARHRRPVSRWVSNACWRYSKPTRLNPSRGIPIFICCCRAKPVPVMD